MCLFIGGSRGICSGQTLISQKDSFVLILRSDLRAVSVEADFQGNIYLVNTLNELIQLDESGNILRRYSNNYLGQLQLISIHNPLQIVLFYPGFQTLIILDKGLNELKRIGMDQLNIPYVSTVGYSAEREVWYFDEQLQRFKKVNIHGRHILESNLENRYQPVRVQKIRIQKNEIKAWCDSTVLITLDLNGNFKGESRHKGEWVYWKEERIAFFNNQEIMTFTYQDGTPPVPDQTIRIKDMPWIQSICLLDIGYAAIDRDGQFYLFRLKPGR